MRARRTLTALVVAGVASLGAGPAPGCGTPAAGPAPSATTARGDTSPDDTSPDDTSPDDTSPDDPGLVDLRDGDRALRYLLLTANGPEGARGTWQPDFPLRRDPPDDDETTFLAGSPTTADAARIPQATFSGRFTGRLRNVTLTQYRGTFLEQYPPQQQLHLRLVVSGTVVFDGPVDVALTAGRPDVCHSGHYGSYRTGLWHVDRAIAAAGLTMGDEIVHELVIGVAPTGDGVMAPATEIFAADTQHTPSMLAFNRSRPPAVFREAGT